MGITADKQAITTGHAFIFGRNTLIIGVNHTDMLLLDTLHTLTIRVQDYKAKTAPAGHRTLLIFYHAPEEKLKPQKQEINASLARWLLRELHNTLKSHGGNGLIMTPLETSAGDSLRIYVPEGSHSIVTKYINDTLAELCTFYAAMQDKMGQRLVINIGRQSPAFRNLYLRIEQTLDSFSHLRITAKP